MSSPLQTQFYKVCDCNKKELNLHCSASLVSKFQKLKDQILEILETTNKKCI